MLKEKALKIENKKEREEKLLLIKKLTQRKDLLLIENKTLLNHGNGNQYQENCMRINNLTKEIYYVKKKVTELAAN